MNTTVSTKQERAAAVNATDEVLAKHGITNGPDFFEAGHSAGSWTEEGYRRVRAEYHAMKDAEPALLSVRDAVQAEQRQDYDLTLGDLKWSGQGTLLTPGGVFVPEHRALPDLFSKVVLGVSATSTARDLTEQGRYLERDDLFASLLAGTVARDADHLGKDITIRTREQADGRRGMFALVSQRYTRHDIDQVVTSLVGTLKQNGLLDKAKGEVAYDGTNLDARVLWFHEHTSPCTGDTFQIGIRVKANDAGKGGIPVSLVAYRNKCQNYIIIGTSHVKLGSVPHKGNPNVVAQKVRALFQKAKGAASEVMKVWTDSERDMILASGVDGRRTPTEVFDNLIKQKLVTVPGFASNDGHEALVQRFVQAYHAEPAKGTRSAFVNALTRAAHTYSWASPWTAASIEEQAGDLLYVRNLAGRLG